MAMEHKVVGCRRSCTDGIRSKGGDRRFARGYDTSHLPADVIQELDELKKPRTGLAVAEALMTALSIPALALAALLGIETLQATSASSWVVCVAGGALYVATIIAIARQQRGMEIMVHDASHRTWHPSERLNNILADLIVASPVLSSIATYWRSHRVHHGRFGSHSDPCLARFERMGLGHIDLSTRWKLAVAVFRWIAPYSIEYYQEIGSASAALIGRFLAWHALVYLIPTAFGIAWIGGVNGFLAIAYAFDAWILFWMVPWVGVLPVVRSIAESEEHDYDRADTEFATTFSNLGWAHRILFHPKKDGFHVVHHMYPNIPERVHHKVHALLMKCDPKYRDAAIRTRVLEIVE